MTLDDIIRMALESGIVPYSKHEWLNSRFVATDDGMDGDFASLLQFAALVAAAKQEQIARQWDALHEQYMADPLRRQMMLIYEMVARMIRGRT